MPTQSGSRAILALVLLILIVLEAGVPASGHFAQAEEPRANAVRIGVFGLFHPSQLKVTPVAGAALVVHAGKEMIALEKSSGVESITVQSSTTGILLLVGKRVLHVPAVALSGRMDESTDFMLSVPDKISRRYRGTLEIGASEGKLTAVVRMDLETAVASVVAAESAPGTPLEALKAQAIASRSYFVASRGRHRDFDFCDTTHCQFLREPPTISSAATRAVEATRGMLLAYHAQPLPTMYTRSCSGRTRTPGDVGLPSDGYPYYSVECKYCRSHPARWTSRISASDATRLRSSDEFARLAVDRVLGWSAVPSNDFTISMSNSHAANEKVVLEGKGQGHGIGLCQAGARFMAKEGASFREILSYYYPNTAIVHGPRGIRTNGNSSSPTRRAALP